MEIYRTPVSKNGKRNDPAVVAAAGRLAQTRTVSSRQYSLKKVVSMNERYTTY